MSLLDHPIISARYFFPPPPEVADRVALDDPFVVEHDGVELHCHREAPHEGAPWLLHFHGNAEAVASWLRDFAPALVNAGLNVCFAEYRGYAGSSGTPALATMLDDAVAVADALEVSPQQLVVYGRSVGSIYALHVAAERQVGGLILESGAADIFERLMVRLIPSELDTTADELRRAVAEQLDQQAKIQCYRGPVLVLHAEGDQLVSVDHARSLAAWAAERGRLVTFEQGDHNDIYAVNRERILQEVVDFAKTSTA